MAWRVLLVFAAIGALLYGVICVSLYFGQRAQIYHPEASWSVRHATDFVMQRDGVTLRGWVMNPGKPQALLYFGGNGERIEDVRESFAAWFPERSIYLVPYRSYGASDGDPSEAKLMGDALGLFDLVATQHAHVAVIGRSLGTGVAMQVAAQRPVEKLVLVTPFDSLARVAAGYFPWLPVNLLLIDRFESWRYAPKVHCPVLIVRAGEDEIIPVERTLALAKSLPQAQVQVIPEAGHNSVQEFSEYRVGLKRFLN